MGLEDKQVQVLLLAELEVQLPPVWRLDKAMYVIVVEMAVMEMVPVIQVAVEVERVGRWEMVLTEESEMTILPMVLVGVVVDTVVVFQAKIIKRQLVVLVVITI